MHKTEDELEAGDDFTENVRSLYLFKASDVICLQGDEREIEQETVLRPVSYYLYFVILWLFSF